VSVPFLVRKLQKAYVYRGATLTAQQTDSLARNETDSQAQKSGFEVKSS